MHALTDAPSMFVRIPSSVLSFHKTKKTANLDDFPASGQLVLKVLLNARDHSRIVALLDAVLSADNDFARLAVPEQKDLLRRERDHVHGGVIFQEAARAHVHLPDVKHFRVRRKALSEILLHRSPEYVISLEEKQSTTCPVLVGWEDELLRNTTI